MVLISDYGDEYFPRGGTGAQIKFPSSKRTFPFDKKDEPQKKKKLGRRERKAVKKAAPPKIDFEPKEERICFERVEPLVYNALSEGTLSLCSVREICKNYVDICMPGRLSARLYIDNVSQPYNEAIKMPSDALSVAPLKSLFHIGQHLSCSVLSVRYSDHFLVRVTSDPKHINQNQTFENVREGSLIQMAVQSIEDHGFMMYSGIDGLISFLPASNAKSYIDTTRNHQQLEIGQILWCLVTNSKLSETSNLVQVSIDMELVQANKIKNDITIERLNPGVRVEVIINKVVSQSLMVTVSESDINGYIEPSQLSSMWSKPNDYNIGSKHTATVLFKFPYPKVVAFTLKSNPGTISREEIECGTIFKRAEVMAILKRGVALKLELNDKTYKGVISVRRLGPGIDFEKLSTMFPVGNHITCRVIGYDSLEQVYSCTTQDNILNEKYLSPKDLIVGEIVEVTIDTMNKGGLEVSVGGIKGFVPPHHVSDVLIQNPLDKWKLFSKTKAKVLRIANNNVLFTLRPTLVKTPSLSSFNNIKVGDSYFGTVTKIQPASITVGFFGNLFTHIEEINLIESANKYTVGELVKCYVVEPKRFQKMPVFSLLKSIQRMYVTVGEKYDIRVKRLLHNGAECLFMCKEQSFDGFIPLEYMSDHKNLCKIMLKKYPHYSVIENARLFSVTDRTHTFTIRKSVDNFFQEHADFKGFAQLNNNMILPASVSEISSDNIMVCVPVPGFNAKVMIEKKRLPQDPYEYNIFQGLSVKITKFNPSNLEMSLTCLLSNTEKREWALSNVKNYLKDIAPLQSVKMGTELECNVTEVRTTYVKVSTELGIDGFIRSLKAPKSLKKEQTIKAVVIYHDILRNMLYLLTSYEAAKIGGTQQTHLLNKKVPGNFLFGNSDIIATVIQSGTGRHLVFIPTKEDPNVSKYINVNEIVPCSPCTVTLKEAQTSEKMNYWIGLAQGFKKKTTSTKERVDTDSEISDNSELEVTCDSPVIRNDISKLKNKGNSDKDLQKIKSAVIDDNIVKNTKKKRKSEDLNKPKNEQHSPSKKKSICDSKRTEKPKKEHNATCNSNSLSNKNNKQSNSLENFTLEDVGFEWDATPADLTKVISGIDVNVKEEDILSQDSGDEMKKPKKLTSDQELSAIKTEKSDRDEMLFIEQNPQTPEHFERLAPDQLNNSKFWNKYISHHLVATEVDKARAVAKRAVKEIDIVFEADRLSVWLSLLNIEYLYSTPEIFKETLSEALKCNDEQRIYKKVLDLYATSKNITELDNLANTLVRKYKENVDCWLMCQSALMKAELYDKARFFLHRSLGVLPVKDHCTLISRFALVENEYGFPERARTLFENLLTTYPKRVDLWSVFADMIIKHGSVEEARNVFERATAHKLPIKKMKALYQKWLKFEEVNGTEENVQQVKEAANEYVNNLVNSIKQPL